MKKITIKCINEDIYMQEKYQIIVLDGNDIIINKYTNRCSETFFLEKGVYNIIIQSLSSSIYSVFLVTDENNTFVYYLKNKNPLITIKVTDKLYPLLKINKGRIYLWPNHIQ